MTDNQDKIATDPNKVDAIKLALMLRENPRSNRGGAYPWMRFMKASKRGTVNAAYPYRGL